MKVSKGRSQPEIAATALILEAWFWVNHFFTESVLILSHCISVQLASWISRLGVPQDLQPGGAHPLLAGRLVRGGGFGLDGVGGAGSVPVFLVLGVFLFRSLF